MLESVMPYVYGGIALLSALCFALVIWLGRSLRKSEAPAPVGEEKGREDSKTSESITG